jgi:hypothetical protein
MRLIAQQMSSSAWLLLAAVLIVGTIRIPRPEDDVAWRATPSAAVVEPAAPAPRRAAVAPAASVRQRPKVAERAEGRKAAAMLLLLMVGRDRFASVPR